MEITRGLTLHGATGSLIDSLLPDNEVDIDGGVNLEVGDVLDGAGWAHDVNNSFVDSHFKSIPGVGSLSTWTFTAGNSQSLCWDSNWSFSLVPLVLGVGNNLGAGFFQWLGLSSSQGHSKHQN